MTIDSLLRRLRVVAPLALVAGLLGASPALAASAAVNPLGCAATHDLNTPLTGFGDSNLYAEAPGGGFEFGTNIGWTMLNATVVSGNEPWNVGGATDSRSLRIGPGGVVISSAMCVDETFPNFRFFARNLGAKGATLTVKVLFLDAKGGVKSTKSGELKDVGTGWTLVRPMDIGVTFSRTALNAAAPIAFQFVADKTGDWRVDDLLVDPYRRG